MPLEEAFAVYEEYRAVMMEFINTVPDYLTTISPKVRHLILKAAWFMDKKYYTAQMRELLDALKARPKEDFTGKKFLVTGIMLDAEPVLELLEELGVAVVDDLLCHESMQFRTPTRAGGTVESKLAYRFLDLKGASPLYEPRKPRGELLAQLARERGADGVLFCLMKFCDPEAFDHPLVKERLGSPGNPSAEHRARPTRRIHRAASHQNTGDFWKLICLKEDEKGEIAVYLGWILVPLRQRQFCWEKIRNPWRPRW